MRKVGQGFEVSASDLVGYLYCRHLSALDRAVAEGTLKRPPITDDLFLKILWGLIHEESYVQHLTKSGLEVVKIEGVAVTDAAVAETVAAMKSGVQVIAQGALSYGGWVGRADILHRVERQAPWVVGLMSPSIPRLLEKRKQERFSNFVFIPSLSKKFRAWLPSICLLWCPGPILSRTNTDLSTTRHFFGGSDRGFCSR